MEDNWVTPIIQQIAIAMADILTLSTVLWDKYSLHYFVRRFESNLNMHLCASTTLNNKHSLLMHCIKIKSPAKFLLNEQYVFVGGNISFLCVLSCSSEEA